MLRLWPILSAFAVLAALALACNGGGAGTTAPAGETPTAGETPASSPALAPTPMRFAERPEITISGDEKIFAIVETEKGSFRIELRPDLALETVNSFIFLARQGYFNGVTFHRVIPGFVAQGGDPTGTGNGGPGYTLPAEFSDVPYERGTVGMARLGNDPNSGGSQFFIAYDDQPGLDGQFTVFGEVVEGMDVVDALTPRDPDVDVNPPPGDVIIGIEIEEG